MPACDRNTGTCACTYSSCSRRGNCCQCGFPAAGRSTPPVFTPAGEKSMTVPCATDAGPRHWSVVAMISAVITADDHAAP